MKHTKRRFAAILLGIGMMFSSAASLHAQSQWLDKVTLYFPNRVLDLLDSFTSRYAGRRSMSVATNGPTSL